MLGAIGVQRNVAKPSILVAGTCSAAHTHRAWERQTVCQVLMRGPAVQGPQGTSGRLTNPASHRERRQATY